MEGQAQTKGHGIIVAILVVIVLIFVFAFVVWRIECATDVQDDDGATESLLGRDLAEMPCAGGTLGRVCGPNNELPNRPLEPRDPSPEFIPHVAGKCSAEREPSSWPAVRSYPAIVTPNGVNACGCELSCNPYGDWQAAHGAPVGESDCLDYPGLPYSGLMGSDVHPIKLNPAVGPRPDLACDQPYGVFRAPCGSSPGVSCADQAAAAAGDCATSRYPRPSCGNFDGSYVGYDMMGLPQRWLNSMDTVMGLPNGIEPDYDGDHYARGAGQLGEKTHGRTVHMFTPDHEPLIS